MKKTLLFWLCFIVSILFAIYFSTRIITGYMGRGPISYVKHITVIKDNNQDFDIESVKMAIGVNSNTPIRNIDLHQINNRITNIPGIKNASVRRMPNGNLIIKIQPHNVVAMWSDGAYYYPLSDDGTKIETPMSEREPNTIVFRGETPENLTEIINAVAQLSDYIDYMERIESRRWNIHTKSGTTIYLPEDDDIAAINKLARLNQTHKILSRKISVIDMRDDKRILIQESK